MAYIKKERILADILDMQVINKLQLSRDIIEKFYRIVDSQPTADVVGVVRCKDCKHNYKNGGDCDRVLIHTRRNLVLERNEYLYYKLNHCEYGEKRSDT